MLVDTRLKFDARMQDILTYLQFVDQCEKASAKLFITRGRKPRQFTISADLKKILRASFFLIFYNVVEMTFSDALIEIYQNAKLATVIFPDLKEAWQDLLVKEHAKPFFSNQSTHYDNIRELMCKTGLQHILDLSKIPISGNVDHRMISDYCARLAIRLTPPKTARGGIVLQVVKSKRNSLAHGEESFSEVGRDFTFDSLSDINRRATVYMRSFLRACDTYIDHARYKR